MSALRGAAVPGVAVAGSGVFLPADRLRRVTNAEIDELQAGRGERPMSPEWIATMGVSERWWSAVPGEPAALDAVSTDELLAGAAEVALADAGLAVADVDLLIAATTTTSRLTTSMASMAGGRLGHVGASFELRAGCASASVALVMAYGQLAVGAECVVVTGAETLSKVAPRGGPLPYVAADGAGAVVLVRTDDPERGLLGSWVSGDGSASSLAGAPGALPPVASVLDADDYRLIADRRFDEAARPWWSMGPSEVLASAGAAAADVSAFVANQASRPRITESAASAGIAASAVVDLVAETANAGAASQLMAFDRARRDGRAAPGAAVMLSAVGGGINAATLLLRP